MTAHILADQLKAAAEAQASQITSQAGAQALHLRALSKKLAGTLESVENSVGIMLDHWRVLIVAQMKEIDELASKVEVGAAILPPTPVPDFKTDAGEFQREIESMPDPATRED